MVNIARISVPYRRQVSLFLIRYFPAQAVQCATNVGGKTPNGGCEAFVELQKALNVLGDYTAPSSVNTVRWAMNAGNQANDGTGTFNILPEFDYDYGLTQYNVYGAPIVVRQAQYTQSTSTTAASGQQKSGEIGSSCFAMAIDLETSNGLEISGLNAEEQSDISLIARYSSTQTSGFVFDVFTYIDSMIVLRENNVMYLLT